MTETVLKSGQISFLKGRNVVWFSCGAASAVTAKLAVEKYGNPEIVNCDTMPDEHEDNPRFFKDVQDWIGCEIKQIRNPIYKTTDEVFEATKYIAGISGARCTTELKKKPRIAFQVSEDTHFFGLTSDEPKRIKDFEWNNPELRCEWILRDNGITKDRCFEILKAARIKLPAMYALGYANNNCKGCVKATSPKYWNLVRKTFPEVFERRSSISRKLGVRLVRLKGVRIFLDELPPDETEDIKEDLSCGVACYTPSITSQPQ